MGDASIKGRSPLLSGGRVGLRQGGPYLPLRGVSGPKGVAKAFRGKAGFKESQALQKKLKSDYRLKNELKRVQKMPDKKFKSYNPAKEKIKTRHGRVYEVHKSGPVKGSLGKKTYKGHMKRYHQAHKRMGLIKD